MKKINVLPQTFYEFECDESLVNEVLTLAKEEQYTIQRYGDPSSNSYTKNTTLHKEERYSKLINWIYKCINEFKEDLNLECDKFTITQCWLNSSKYGQTHHRHIHPNSFLSGIFYLNDSDSNTIFVGKNSWKPMSSFFGLCKIINVLPYDDPDLGIIHEENTVKGKLILFPSSVAHLTSPSCSFSDTRYTLSFNAFPSGKIGNMDFISGLELEIK